MVYKVQRIVDRFRPSVRVFNNSVVQSPLCICALLFWERFIKLRDARLHRLRAWL